MSPEHQDLSQVRALAFDTGGTLLDWHAGIAAELRAAFEPQGIEADWSEVTNAWRRAALETLKAPPVDDRVRPNADEVHRSTLRDTLRRFGLPGEDEAVSERLVGRWHALDPWPDVTRGLRTLRERFVVVPLTLLNTSLIVDASRRAGLDWDCVISCEMMGVYKPQPEAYLTAARWLGLRPEQMLMVACHNGDLEAASAVGYRTAFVSRPTEWGAKATPATPLPLVDLVVDGLLALAETLAQSASDHCPAQTA